MKKIKLSKDRYVLVDNNDFIRLNQWKWYLSNKGYAYRSGKPNIYMHRIINKTPKGLDTDHINRNRLDNRRSNLRTVTNSQNHFNTDLQSNNTSGYKGVHFAKRKNKWLVYIGSKITRRYLGYFETYKKAVKARKEAERNYIYV